MSGRKLLLTLCISALAACTDLSTEPVAVSFGEDPASLIADCDTVDGIAAQCNPVAGPWEYPATLGPLGDNLYEAPNDPVTAYTHAGLWLGPNVHPAACFANQAGGPIQDSDSDWLADHCEYEIARAFAPTMRISLEDGCSGGEPYWAAKYFTGGTVRIAYMPAYYDDCGPYGDPSGMSQGHHGDSEYAMVEVTYDAASQHWKFSQMWLSAHFREGAFDRSRWVTTNAEFTKANRPLSHPTIWVAKRKHANYPSYGVCTQTTFGDRCGNGYFPLRMPVDPARNVGSRFVDAGCRPSTTWFPGSGRAECFYTEQKFHGWYPHAVANTGVTPYRTFLTSEAFEKLCYNWPFLQSDKDKLTGCAGYDHGPGPAAYAPPPPPPVDIIVSISGAAIVPANSTCGYIASASGGAGGPYTLTWFKGKTQLGTGEYMYVSTGDSDFSVSVTASGPGGTTGNAFKSVTVTSGGTCADQ